MLCNPATSSKAVADMAIVADKILLKERAQKCDHRGFTLIELLVVIAIIAVLMAIKTPNTGCLLKRLIYSVDVFLKVVILQTFIASLNMVAKFAIINLGELPAESLLTWPYPQHLVFLMMNRVSSRWVRQIGSLRLAQIRGIEIWNHEINKRAIQIRSFSS
jgi:prepilin-type N-terminal cleavage/methylation domain-containing protein